MVEQALALPGAIIENRRVEIVKSELPAAVGQEAAHTDAAAQLLNWWKCGCKPSMPAHWGPDLLTAQAMQRSNEARYGRLYSNRARCSIRCSWVSVLDRGKSKRSRLAPRCWSEVWQSWEVWR